MTGKERTNWVTIARMNNKAIVLSKIQNFQTICFIIFSQNIGTDEIFVISEEISVHSVREIASDEKTEEDSIHNRKSTLAKIFESIGVSVFGIIGFNLVCIIPWTSVPRTDSIIYQSHWWEHILLTSITGMTGSGQIILDLITWTNEKAIMSMWNYLKIFSMLLIPYTILYVSSYLVWCVFLQYNHPLPYFALILIPAVMTQAIGLWFVLPSHLLAKKDFRRKLKWYNLLLLYIVFVALLREGLALLFFYFPEGFQFLVAFIIAGCRDLDKRVRSNMVTKITGIQDEASTVLLVVIISSVWGLFIASRLLASEILTICCVTAIDFALHLKKTLQIIKSSRKTTDTGIEIVSLESHKNISTLIIVELIEGFTPLIYGTCILMAFYGPNAKLFANIGNTHWGNEIEDFSPLYVKMSILFGVDTMSFLMNSFCLWKVLNVNMLSETYRVLSKYWYFIAIYLSSNTNSNICSLDINIGYDPSASFLWITNEGWVTLVNDSTALTNEEKARLIAKVTLD